MKQYNSIKARYPDALLLFRVGDFYELFGDDAVVASKILGIVLTKRKNGVAAFIDLAGFPHHSLETYMPKLVRAGHRVAICDQLEDPKLTKTIVKRGVTELITPGVAYSDHVLDTKSNNFLAAVIIQKNQAGVAFLDISTGEFLVSEGSFDHIDKLLQSFSPSEVLFKKHGEQGIQAAFGSQFHTHALEDWVFTTDYAQQKLTDHFDTVSLKGFGIEELELGIIAGGAALHYLGETKHDRHDHVKSISRIQADEFVWLDRFTIRNLELVYSHNEQAITLIDTMDHTVSPMGGRLLKRWMVLPSKEISVVQKRHDIVEHLTQSTDEAEHLSRHIKQIGDLERLISKVAVGRVNPKEVVQVHRALTNIIPIKEYCAASGKKELEKIAHLLDPCDEIREKIGSWVEEDPPILLSKGSVIQEGVNKDLDDLRQVAYAGKDYLLEIQKRETEATGIPSLKISYNNVFGYYLEVRNAHKDKVPESWIRKQTLTQAERYITEELKTYESKILGAEEKILALETRLFNELVDHLAQFLTSIQISARQIANIDVLLSFAKIALRNNYVRPRMTEGTDLRILEGRHPVIEQNLPLGEPYVANDVNLDTETQQIMMITGPNMSGKSALLRQTALIALMAQMGSYVPAKAADLGMVDKIFTRVGASDNISSGESTFMVEMNETASILNNLSGRSLVLLDEIGRGTSTYDGISIAWAIAEFIHENPKARAKTLFATHYHELNEMAEVFSRIKNYNVSVKESGKRVIFLRKLESGGSNHSFGIHVAKMAGMPAQAVKRAEEILKKLEKSHSSDLRQEAREIAQDAAMQLSFFKLDDPVLEQIKEEIIATDINTLTPIEALMKLNDIKKMVGG